MIGVRRFVGCVVFPSNKMAIHALGKDYIVYIAKRLVFFAPNFVKKSPFVNA
jgi:hypothetical protein